jgi:tetratricopeptide (TPR) repeat protein
MGKGEFLDIVDKTEVSSRQSEVKTSSLILIILLLFVPCLLTAGCSLPRIVILDDPLTPEEHINLGIAYEKKGETDNAVEEYKKASKKLPLAYLYLGNVFMQKGDLDTAEGYYKKVIEEKPDIADAYNNLAWLYYKKGKNLSEAESLVLKALDLSPSNENYKDTLNKIRELLRKN